MSFHALHPMRQYLIHHHYYVSVLHCYDVLALRYYHFISSSHHYMYKTQYGM